jgi:hypothetical protein
MGTTLTIELRSVDDVRREWANHLSKGGAYVRGASADGAVTLVLVGPAGPLELAARTVFRSGDGVGLELHGFGPELRDRIEVWVEACASMPAPRRGDDDGASLDDGLDGATVRAAPADGFDGATVRDAHGALGTAETITAAAIAETMVAAAVTPTAAVDDFDPPTTRAQPGLPTVRFSMGEVRAFTPERVASPPAPPRPAARAPAPPLPRAEPPPVDLGIDLGAADAPLDLGLDLELGEPDVAAPVPAPAPAPAVVASDDGDHEPADRDSADAAAERHDDDDDDDDPDPVFRSAREKLRNLPVAQQLRVAREGELNERIALERMYGKTVWEALLRNPRITHPEVARISRMGALPRPLIELIVGNTAWLRSPEVRRALLGNIRLTADMIPRILRLLPKHELKLVPSQSAYSLAVRDAARKLLKDQV